MLDGAAIAAQFREWIADLCGTDPGAVDDDGDWHRFRISDTRRKSSTPGAYMLHNDQHPVGLFMDWRREREVYCWRPGGEAKPIDKEEARRLAKERADKRKAQYTEAAASALRFFQKDCTAINGASHPYLDRKQIAPHGARQGSGRPFGLGDTPCVIIPVRGPDKGALTVQAIRADGERRFWKGSTTEGGYCLIGPPKSDGPIVLCEGFATGASIFQATGLLVIVCLNASNMVRVSRWAGHQYPGRDFIVAGDDDWHLPLKEKPEPNAGREAAEHAARNLGGRAVLPDMCGIATDGGDDFNDMAIHVGLDDVRALILGEPMQMAEREPDRSPEPAAPAVLDAPQQPLPPEYQSGDSDFGQKPESTDLVLISPSVWQGITAPPREWRLDHFIPNRQATLFTGAGAVGKSLANQVMTTCIGMGMPFLGVKTMATPSLYVTCEDDADELHRRQTSICQGLRIPLSETQGRVFLLSLYGELGNALGYFDDGVLTPAPRYEQIVKACRMFDIHHVTLDNTAHFFTGNEIKRDEVAAFVNLCNRLARDIDGSVVIVGHPNKQGDSYSGSTAWENQVRSRLFMETPSGPDGITSDPDLRVIRSEKANYAPRNKEVHFFWFNGTFVLEDQIGEEDRRKMLENAATHHDDMLFLKLLEQLTKEKRHVSHSPNGGNYAPKVMAQMTEARTTTKPQFVAAMERLFRDDVIVANKPLWMGTDRHIVHGLALNEVKNENH